jgi:hypothetical protein
MIDASWGLESGAGDREATASEDETQRGREVVVGWGGWQAVGDGAHKKVSVVRRDQRDCLLDDGELMIGEG